jgi:hypothetical protein
LLFEEATGCSSLPKVNFLREKKGICFKDLQREKKSCSPEGNNRSVWPGGEFAAEEKKMFNKKSCPISWQQKRLLLLINGNC